MINFYLFTIYLSTNYPFGQFCVLPDFFMSFVTIFLFGRRSRGAQRTTKALRI